MDSAKWLEGYAGRVSAALMKSDFDALAKAAQMILATKNTGARVFTAGNGGSHATASHMSNDLVKGCRVLGREGFRCICLGDLSAIVTCLANDFSYDEVYEIMLRTYAAPGDLLIVFSGSGNSSNIVRAAKTAKDMGMAVLGFGGRDGGRMKEYCDLLVLAPTESMEELEDIHLIYEHDLVTLLGELLSDGFDIETIGYAPPGRRFRSALFDFDGTISLIREGWQGVMIPYFADELSKVYDGDDAYDFTAEFVHVLTGKQTIFQCMRLADEIRARGGAPLAPGEYKAEYLRRLMIHIKDRRGALEKGAGPRGYLVKGSLEIIEALKSHGVRLYLASGTDECDVLEEARLLGVDKYFDGGIFGAREDDVDCSKELVIRRILAEDSLDPKELVAFGDGFVEIELTKSAGGYPIAVATDESQEYAIDRGKRERLIKAGAMMVIPHFGGEAEAARICRAIGFR